MTTTPKMPSRKHLKQATLTALCTLGGIASIDKIDAKLIEQEDITPELLSIPRGKESSALRYKFRWVRTMLKQDGLLTNPKRGTWELSDEVLNKLTDPSIPKEAISNVPSIGNDSPKKIQMVSNYYERDLKVVTYVLNEANGVCECCGEPAPFERDNETPFLEVHHLKGLGKGGSDTPRNAVALCPNCHRELHYGKNRLEKMEAIYAKVGRLIKE